MYRQGTIRMREFFSRSKTATMQVVVAMAYVASQQNDAALHLLDEYAV